MEIKINITENNEQILRRQLRDYNLFNDANMSLDSFKELVFINGLIGMMNGVDFRTQRSLDFIESRSRIINGEIVEYR